ncbi:MAG: type VI secretion system baseplate subunit TssG [Planctomycetes bacterium]|nr:type VI secretion system baseplate subunit TssG [Planctomycetota bacterium]
MTEIGSSDAQRVAADGARHDFVQAVRLLERALDDAVPLGRQGPAERECVRLRPELSLAFATTEVSGVDAGRDSSGRPRWQLSTPLMGLYGTGSPLPAYLTERLLAHDDDGLARGVVDLIHHRLLSLLYRALIVYRPALPQAGHDDFARRLVQLLGLHVPERARVRPEFLLAYAGILSRQPRGAEAIEQVLADWFKVPVTVEQCVARWTAVPGDALTRLGVANAGLGSGALLGARVFERATTFAVAIGPVPHRDFIRYLPGGDLHDEVREIVALLDGGGFDYACAVIVDTEGMPRQALGAQAGALGRDARLAGSPGRYHTARVMVASA